MSKSRDAFRTISEVAEWLDTPAHVLRFWESKFSQVKPVKRAGGRRYYRPGDMELLAGIKKLLHDDGLTIKGVQKILREQGVKHVSSLCELSVDADEGGDTLEAVEQAVPVQDAPFADVSQDHGDSTVVSFPGQDSDSDAETVAAENLDEADASEAGPEISDSEQDTSDDAEVVAEPESDMTPENAAFSEETSDAAFEALADAHTGADPETGEQPEVEHAEARDTDEVALAEDAPTATEAETEVPEVVAATPDAEALEESPADEADEIVHAAAFDEVEDATADTDGTLTGFEEGQEATTTSGPVDDGAEVGLSAEPVAESADMVPAADGQTAPVVQDQALPVTAPEYLSTHDDGDSTPDDNQGEPAEAGVEPVAGDETGRDPGPAVLIALSRIDRLSARQVADIAPLVQRLREVSEGLRKRL